jgi:MFS family permease
MRMQHAASEVLVAPAAAESTYRKVAWRLLPFLMVCYVVAYLDRVNVGFAKLAMGADLQLSEAVYGLGAGIFFIGYFLFEVPSNVLLHKLGARTWIARIMITWALVSASCSLINGPTFFYIARFVLGVAEAGFFPGIILYLTYWFPSARRGQIIATFMMAIPLAGLVGAPLSGLIMDRFDGLAGWAGWRWMFLIEAAPALLLGLAVPAMLTSRVSEAAWLAPEERSRIAADLAAEQGAAPKAHARIRDLFTDPLLLRFAFIYFCCIMGQYGVTFWLPSMVATVAKGASNLTVGLISALPYACAVVVMALAGRNSDRTGERRWHLIVMLIVGAAAIALAPFATDGAVLPVILLCVAAAAILTATPLFWNLPTATLAGTAAAVGIAAINSLGNLAGFLSPFMVGWINERTGAAAAGMAILAFVLLVGAAGVLTVKNPPRA